MLTRPNSLSMTNNVRMDNSVKPDFGPFGTISPNPYHYQGRLSTAKNNGLAISWAPTAIPGQICTVLSPCHFHGFRFPPLRKAQTHPQNRVSAPSRPLPRVLPSRPFRLCWMVGSGVKQLVAKQHFFVLSKRDKKCQTGVNEVGRFEVLYWRPKWANVARTASQQS